jgi:beta-1,4-mannosyl-glycoprotein beta-1,4-N-acetylglucosaminyltransferase
MKIIDTTTYFKEDLILDLRFNILDKYVDYFVVCEARFTHSGNEKPLYFDIKNFPKFKNKIIYLVLDNEPENINYQNNDKTEILRNNSILRINHQRDFIKNALENFSKEDIVLYSDNDEIPNLTKVNFDKILDKIIIFNQKLFYYKLNLHLPKVEWFGTKGCSVKNLKSLTWLRNIKNKKYNFFRFDTIFSNTKYKDIILINEGGWHFSNLKDIKELRLKYLNDENYAEFSQKMTLDKIKKDIDNRVIDYDHFADKRSQFKQTKKKLNKYNLNKLPKYIQINKTLYKDWLI